MTGQSILNLVATYKARTSPPVNVDVNIEVLLFPMQTVPSQCFMACMILCQDTHDSIIKLHAKFRSCDYSE
jgi:hypothetical protein